MTNNKALIEKIKAILAKAASTEFEEEAAIFTAKAHELMEMHQISILDFTADDPIGQDEDFKGYKSAIHKRTLYAQVASYYGCKPILHMTGANTFTVRIVGRESARMTTSVMFPFIMSQVRAAATRIYEEKKHLGELTVAIVERRVANALSLRLSRLMKNDKPEPSTMAGKNALVTLDAVQAWVDANCGPLKTGKPTKVSTNAEARAAAEGISLNRQAGSTRAKQIGGR